MISCNGETTENGEKSIYIIKYSAFWKKKNTVPGIPALTVNVYCIALNES